MVEPDDRPVRDQAQPHSRDYRPGHQNHLAADYDPVSGKSAYRPNKIPRCERLSYGALAAGLMAYAVVALLADDFWIPGRRGPGIHLSGVALWFACAGFGCLCVALVSVLVDHFDQRNNEKSYAKVLRLFALGGAGLFVIALVLHWLKIGGWM